MKTGMLISDHSQGTIQAPIVLIEYGDYECPYCEKANRIVKDIQKKLGKNLMYIFRNYPIQELHPHALHAAMAAEASGLQGKFWEMHDKLFGNQRRLEDVDIIRYAKEIGLNLKTFKEDFGSDHIIDKIESDVRTGNQDGVRGTPAFYVNGREYNGNWMDPALIRYMESTV